MSSTIKTKSTLPPDHPRVIQAVIEQILVMPNDELQRRLAPRPVTGPSQATSYASGSRFTAKDAETTAKVIKTIEEMPHEELMALLKHRSEGVTERGYYDWAMKQAKKHESPRKKARASEGKQP